MEVGNGPNAVEGSIVKIDLVQTKVEIVHILRSEEDRTTLCGGVPWWWRVADAGTTLILCKECWVALYKKKE